MATLKLKIEKNVPLLPRGNVIYPFREMDVGDSIFIAGEKAGEKARCAAIMWARRSSKTIVTRKVDGGCRIWRTA